MHLPEKTFSEKAICAAIDARRRALARRIDMLQGCIEIKDWHGAMDECCDIQCEEEVIKDLRALLDG
ncbi:MAG: hypothetical protein V3U34_00675 [candidate division NC10 bacterium]